MKTEEEIKQLAENEHSKIPLNVNSFVAGYQIAQLHQQARIKELEEENSDLRGTVQTRDSEFEKLEEGNRWIPVSERLPELGGLYLVTQDMDDGQNPLTWALVYDKIENKWFIDDSDNEETGIIAWRDTPEPLKVIKIPKAIMPEPISIDEYERTVYGICVHGENMANCDICNRTN